MEPLCVQLECLRDGCAFLQLLTDSFVDRALRHLGCHFVTDGAERQDVGGVAILTGSRARWLFLHVFHCETRPPIKGLHRLTRSHLAGLAYQATPQCGHRRSALASIVLEIFIPHDKRVDLARNRLLYLLQLVL